VGAADDGDAEGVDVDDDVDEDGLDDLLLPHPVTATPTARVVAAKPAAIADACTTIGSSGVRSQFASVPRNISDPRTHRK
jgi:hypothetical protein